MGNHETFRKEASGRGTFYVVLGNVDPVYEVLKDNQPIVFLDTDTIDTTIDSDSVGQEDRQGDIYFHGLTIVEQYFNSGCFSNIKIAVKRPDPIELSLSRQTTPDYEGFKLNALLNFREPTILDDERSKAIMEALGNKGKSQAVSFMMQRTFKVLDQEWGLVYYLYMPLSSKEEIVGEHDRYVKAARDFLKSWDSLSVDSARDEVGEREEDHADPNRLTKNASYVLIQCTNIYEPIKEGDKWNHSGSYIPLGEKENFREKIYVFGKFLEKVVNVISGSVKSQQEGNLIISVPLEKSG